MLQLKKQEYIIKIKQVLLSLVAIFFPWIIIFADDNPLGGIAALLMQATLIGWIPAVVWAWRILHPKQPAGTTTPPPSQPKPQPSQPPK